MKNAPVHNPSGFPRQHEHSPGDARKIGGHDHAPKDFGAAFAIGTALNLAYVVVQVLFGFLAHSLALLADAGHNLGDVLGLLLAWWASHLVKRRPTESHTYGFGRASILAALANALFLLVAVGAITWEALGRLRHPEPVTGGSVIWVAALGIVINAATALLFMRGRKGDLNIKAAFLHMASDAVVSAGVVAAGCAILFTGWFWIDPAVSLVINVVIAWGAWGLLRDSINLALDAVPAGVDLPAVRSFLEAQPGVIGSHDLHIWALSTTRAALTVHLVKPDAEMDDRLLLEIRQTLHVRFGIEHATIQCERGDASGPCPQASVSEA